MKHDIPFVPSDLRRQVKVERVLQNVHVKLPPKPFQVQKPLPKQRHRAAVYGVTKVKRAPLDRIARKPNPPRLVANVVGAPVKPAYPQQRQMVKKLPKLVYQPQLQKIVFRRPRVRLRKPIQKRQKPVPLVLLKNEPCRPVLNPLAQRGQVNAVQV